MTKQRVPLHEIIARLEEGEDLETIEITLFPPEDNGQITDQESGDENDFDLNHLPGNLLRSEIEIELPIDKFDDKYNHEEEPGLMEITMIGEDVEEKQDSRDEEKNIKHIENAEDGRIEVPRKKRRKIVKNQNKNRKEHTTKSVVDMEEECENNNSLSKNANVSTAVKRKVKKNETNIEWMEDESTFRNRAGNADNDERYSTYNGPEMSCIEWFETMFSNELVSLIRDQSNLYALENNHTLNVTEEEIRVFIAILLLTGYLSPKYMRMFWETQSDTHNSLVSSAMRRNRFFEIQQYLHLADNTTLNSEDKFTKVRAYLNILGNNFQSNFRIIGASHISIDETMVPYYGKHSAKQHIHGKPIKFGYKIWSAATRSGYLITFSPYQGSKNSPLPRQEELGLGAAVVLELSLRLPNDLGPYNVYFDRFFSSVRLITALSEKNMGGTGTVMENRTAKCPLVNSKELSKKGRGSISFKNTENYIVVKWNDNSIVTIISNCHGIEPITKVGRVATIDKKRTRISVDCPNVTKKYNAYMGGVDRFDQNLDSLRINLKGRKWWHPLFAFGIDAACQNAWQLKKHTENNENYTYCDFRRAIVQGYCHMHGTPPKLTPSVKNVPKKPTGPKSKSHQLEDCKEHRRCKLCHKRTRKMCKTCNVGLHIHCSFIMKK